MSKWPLHGRITGPIVMIGFGSIGRGTLPLIERHFEYDKSRFVVIDPSDKNKFLLDKRGIKLIQTGLTKANYREILTPLLTAGGGQGFCVSPQRGQFDRERGALALALARGGDRLPARVQHLQLVHRRQPQRRHGPGRPFAPSVERQAHQRPLAAYHASTSGMIAGTLASSGGASSNTVTS